jgi:hypothetical protein
MVGSRRHHNGQSIEACAAMVVFRRLIGIVAAMLAAGCASTQLNYNAADLATSLNSLTKKQIFFNLAQAINDPEFVPSQVTVSIGTAQTANAITPSLSLPLGPPIATTSRFTTGGNPGAQFSSQLTTASPGIGLQVTDAWNQRGTMVPASSASQLRRLQTLYQYATGTLPRGDMTRDLSEEDAERQFLCEYPMQALAVSASPAGNVIYRLDGCQDNNSRAPRPRIVHADPTFTQGPNCVVCIDDLNATVAMSRRGWRFSQQKSALGPSRRRALSERSRSRNPGTRAPSPAACAARDGMHRAEIARPASRGTAR